MAEGSDGRFEKEIIRCERGRSRDAVDFVGLVELKIGDRENGGAFEYLTEKKKEKEEAQGPGEKAYLPRPPEPLAYYLEHQ